VQEVPSCNGWLFWHLPLRDGRLVLLDELRARVAEELP
jgi:modification methylase